MPLGGMPKLLKTDAHSKSLGRGRYTRLAGDFQERSKSEACDWTVQDDGLDTRVHNYYYQVARFLFVHLSIFTAALLGVLAAGPLERGLRSGRTTWVLDRTNTGVPELSGIPIKPSNFTPHELLGLPATVESDKAWDGLLGPSRGYIALAHPRRYGFPPGIKHPTDPTKEIYGLAMPHSLHCLIRIRKVYYDLVDGRLTSQDFHTPGQPKVTKLLELDNGALHMNHCFDYIQEGIRCAAQMDVQYAVMQNGVGVMTGGRQCKDWEAVYGVLESLSFNDTGMQL